MSVILLISIVLRCLGFGWGCATWWRDRRWPVLIIPALFGLMAIRQILTLGAHLEHMSPHRAWAHQLSELPGLAVSVLMLLGLIFVQDLLTRVRSEEPVGSPGSRRMVGAAVAIGASALVGAGITAAVADTASRQAVARELMESNRRLARLVTIDPDINTDALPRRRVVTVLDRTRLQIASRDQGTLRWNAASNERLRAWRDGALPQGSLVTVTGVEYLAGGIVRAGDQLVVVAAPATDAAVILAAVTNPWSFGFILMAGLLVPTALGLLLVSFRASQRSLARATAATRESDDRLQFTLRETGLALWEWDPRDDTCKWGEVSPAVLGCRPGTRRAWEDRIHPDDRTKIARAIDDHLAGRTESYQVEYRFRTTDDEHRWIRERGVVTARDVDGRPARISGNCRNVDRQRRDRDALARSEARLRSLMDAAPELIVQVDRDGVVAAANRPLPDGTSAIGRCIFDSVAPDGATILRERLALAIADGSAEPVMIRLRGSEDWRWFELHLASIAIENPADRPAETDPACVVLIAHDVTLHRATERTLRESEHRLMTLTRCSPSMVFRTDCDGRATYVNERWLELTGLPDGVWCGDGWAQAVHPEDRPRVQASWARAVAARGPWREEFRFRGDEEKPIWVLAQATPLVNEQGATDGFIGVCNDITELKRVERALQQVTQQLSLVLDSLPVVSYTASLVNGRLQYMSSSVRSITGFPVEQFMADRAFWRSRVHPEDGADLPTGLDEAPASGGEFEYRWRVADGSYRWFAHFVRIEFEADDASPRILGMWQDITKRKEAEVAVRGSEQRFRQLAEHIDEVFWLTDWRAGHVLWISPQYERMWGRTIESLHGDPASWSEVVHPDDRERVVTSFNRDAPLGRYDQQYRLLRDDGTVRWIHDRAFPIHDEHGEVYRVAGLSADITSRVDVEHELRRRSDVERMLFSELDHRVRNNLASLIALIDMTAETTTDSTDFATAIRGRVQAMAAAHGLLTHSRWAAANIRDLIAVLVPGDLPGRLEVEGAELLITPHQSTALAMVLHEIITNSVKHGALGVEGGRVSLSWQPAATAGGTTELRWCERGGPLVELKPTPGLGTSLIEGFARSDLAGEVELCYGPEGVEHRLTMRLEPHATPTRLEP